VRIANYFLLKPAVFWPLLTLLLSLFITYQVVNNAQVELKEKTQTYFDFRARQVTQLIHQRMQAYEQVLLGTAGLFKSSIHVERDEFKEYIDTLNLVGNYPGLQGLGFAAIVAPENKAEHIASVRSEGFPEYRIRPEGKRAVYSSIVYLEPFSGLNLRAFGYDMFSEPVRHKAMQQSIDTGRVALSGKVKLVQETGAQQQAGFLMYVPIYRKGSSTKTIAERRAAAIGWVYSPFRMNDLMQGLFGERANDLHIHIFDGDSLSAASSMYGFDCNALANAALSQLSKIKIEGHSWTIGIHALPAMFLRVPAKQPKLITTIGIFISVLLSLLIWFLVTGRERAINAAKSMNRDLISERQHLSNIIEGTHVGTWEWNVQTGATKFNELWASIIGYQLSELAPTSIDTWTGFLHPDDAKRSGELLAQHFSADLAYYECEARMRHKDGHWVWVLDRGKVWSWTEDGKPLLMSGTHQDITARKLAEASSRIAATAFESQEGMLITDANSIILRVNHAFSRITGYSAEEVVGQTPKLLNSGKQSKAFYAAMWQSINQTGTWEGEIWNRRKSGEIYPQHLIITAVKDEAGIVTNFVASQMDITNSKAASEEIENLAFYDPLTQLPNRRLLLDRLKQALAASTRSGKRGALLFLDLDHFKTINDTLGHDVGDLLLQQVAKRLVACVREGDTVARLGGDEFVVLLEALSKDELEAATQTETIGHKIQAALNQPYKFAAYEHRSTPSLGATLFNDHEASVEMLLKQADIAMYEAKSAGRNALRFFDPKMQEAITARLDIEAELHKAIEQQQFQLYYQVQVGRNGQALGAEALIRWQHPERGLITPFNFIPLAEETGLILPIGRWVLNAACAQLKRWEQQEMTRHLSLSVNVSAKQFHQVDFVEQVQSVVMHHGINPARLNLELTESMLLQNVSAMILKMNALRAIGIRFELDDFGTGYSSLQYLKQLPLYQLKIDQSFVRDIASDGGDRTLVRAIISMAHNLDLEVIAEGVEDEEQREFLKNNGCNYYQGYLFGRPVPIDAFEAVLADS
jgi:diguanylate cyclase (GGDEF)-like protein/PAS domain S-box-containing protein